MVFIVFFTLLPTVLLSLLAWLARNSGREVRMVFATVAGIVALYSLLAAFGDWTTTPMGWFTLPLAVIGLATWLTLTGLCAVAVLQYAAKGQLKSAGSYGAMGLILAVGVVAVLFLLPILFFPFSHR